MNANLKALATTGIFAVTTAVLAPSTVLAQNAETRSDQANDAAMEEEDRMDERQEARETLTDAIATAENMRADEDLDVDMSQVQGVFIVPNYARAAVGVGGSGGEGVLFTRKDGGSGDWSHPMFYNIGAISAGAQAGVEVGEIAMLLMTQEAVDTFGQENNFSLNADAGLTIVDFSERAQATAGKGDIVIWSDTAGVFADLAVTVEDIFWDGDENAAYYGEEVEPDDVLKGDAKPKREGTHPLQGVMDR